MKKELLDLVQDLNFWHKPQETGFRRKELLEVMRFANNPRMALIITGIRRSGKTFLAKQILEEKIKHGEITAEQTLSVNFEDPSLEPFLNTTSLQELYEAYRYFLNKDKMAYLVLDEVQNVPHWEKWVRIMMEKQEKVKFIITGSSSKIAKSELATVLSGRAITFPLFPLDFSTFLNFKGYVLKKYENYSSLSNFLNEYLEFGGFPLVVLSEEKIAYLKHLFDDILVKDIILKHKLRELEIKKIAVLLMNAPLVSVKKLEQSLSDIAKVKISPTSINAYLHYLEDSFLFVFVPIFSYKIKGQMQYPRKVYCLDTGLQNAVALKFSENLGRVYESSVALSLIRKWGKENVFYWKDSAGKEVDFVIKEKLRVKFLIQVCFQPNPSILKRELSGLLKAMEEFKLSESTIITKDQEKEESIEGKKIKYIPLWKLLLEE